MKMLCYPDFDIEFDFKLGRRYCLDSLTSIEDDPSKFKPKSVKRVGNIFDDPKFYVNGPTPNDIRQGRIGDCWLVEALGALGNKPNLIEEVRIARDEEIGVYGFVFFRDGFDWRKSRVPGNPERNKQRQITEEENYRKMYQAHCEDPNETWFSLLEKAHAKDFASTQGGQMGESRISLGPLQRSVS
ncbi:cysteine proteinase [Hyaloscypha bicolor E]|uniref:Cysteine proteinase n=1 Tax=Hyaloscypha bicolor E TaxID=1095630 RepID=A0A2J6TT98_9HELO|nr:cysteine proteinase [Hyaloscypha bicolor E]PMD66237.1 cysteine proteinase [Hyaloscypha bicolor E]